MMTYDEWISANINETYGCCAEATLAMQAAFPELIRVRGEYLCWVWGSRDHWWLKTPDGTIVDPTKDQFPSKGVGEYQERDESQPEPTGRCPNCGEYCYNGDYCCSHDCHVSYVAFCSRGM